MDLKILLREDNGPNDVARCLEKSLEPQKKWSKIFVVFFCLFFNHDNSGLWPGESFGCSPPPPPQFFFCPGHTCQMVVALDKTLKYRLDRGVWGGGLRVADTKWLRHGYFVSAVAENEPPIWTFFWRKLGPF